MNGDLVYIGIGILVLSFIWGMLFVFHKSPIRRKYWSVGEKLVFTVGRGRGNRQYLAVEMELRAIWPIKVDEIRLYIGKEWIIPYDWKSKEVIGDEYISVNLDRPEWLCSGKHSARFIAYSNYGYVRSKVFTVEVRD